MFPAWLHCALALWSSPCIIPHHPVHFPRCIYPPHLCKMFHLWGHIEPDSKEDRKCSISISCVPMSLRQVAWSGQTLSLPFTPIWPGSYDQVGAIFIGNRGWGRVGVGRDFTSLGTCFKWMRLTFFFFFYFLYLFNWVYFFLYLGYYPFTILFLLGRLAGRKHGYEGGFVVGTVHICLQ